MNAPQTFDIPAADLDEAREFLKALDPNAEAFTFCTFDDVETADGKKRKASELTQARHGTLDTLAPWLESMNRRGAGVFVTVNETDGTGKRQKENIKRVRAVWIDDDGKDAAKSNRSLQAAYDALVPSLEVETSPGKRHLYWVADGLSFDDHEGVMRRMVADYNCDRGAADLARVLRVPGFHHAKGALQGEFPRVRVINSRAMIAAITEETPKPLSRADVLKAFPPITREAPAAKAAPETFNPGDWMKPLGFVPNAEDRKRWVDVGAALHFEGGGSEEAFDLWAVWSSTAPNYDKADCERVWASFGKYAGPPLTGDSIKRWAREGGYTGAEVEFADLPDALDTPPAATDGAEAEAPIFVSAERWDGREPEPTPFVIDQLIPRDAVTLLVSAGGRGKSLLALQAMTSVAAGVPFLGQFATECGDALGIFAEDSDNELHKRQKGICAAAGVSHDEVNRKLFPVSFVGRDATLWIANKEKAKNATQLLSKIEAELAVRPGARLLVLDNVSLMFAALEYDRGEVTRFVQKLTQIAARRKVAILLLHHESKTSASNDTHAASGSTAWINACRSVLTLKSDPDPRRKNECTLVHLKSNLGPKADPLLLRRVQGPAFASAGSVQRTLDCQAAAWTMLRKAISDGRHLNLSPHATNCAWKVFAAEQGDFSADEFRHALTVLEKTGVIEEREHTVRGRKRRRLHVLVDDLSDEV